MLNITVRKKREELRKKSSSLQDLFYEIDNPKQNKKVRKNQDELYKKWDFYDKLIKNMEKVENHEVQDQKNRKR